MKPRNMAKTAMLLLGFTYLVSSLTYGGIGWTPASRHLGGMDVTVTGAHYFLKYQTTNFTVSPGTYGVNFYAAPDHDYKINVTWRNFLMLITLGIVYLLGGFIAMQKGGDETKYIQPEGLKGTEAQIAVAAAAKRAQTGVWHFGAITSAVLCVSQILSWSLIQEHIQYLLGSEDATLSAYVVGVVAAFAVTAFALDTDRLLKKTYNGKLTDDAWYMSVVGALVNTFFFLILFTSIFQALALGQTNRTSGTMPVATQAMVYVHVSNLFVSWAVALANLAGSAGWGQFEIPHDQIAAFDHAMLLSNVFVFVFGSIGIYAEVGKMDV